MVKAKKLGAQQVMFWELLQKVREPKGLSWEPQATGLLLGSSLGSAQKSVTTSCLSSPKTRISSCKNQQSVYFGINYK